MTGTQLQLFRDNIASERYLHNTIKITLKEIYEIMKACYGPYGSHVLIDTQVRPEATKDGKTILSKITMSGSISSAVHRSIMSVADKQVEEVGDGSTTTILLLCKLYNAFRSIIESRNVSPSVFNKALGSVIEMINGELKDLAVKVVTEVEGQQVVDYDILRTAVYTSVDGDEELTDIIIKMFQELDSIDPLVLIENSTNESHSYELVKGAELDTNVICPEVFFGGFSRRQYDNPRVLVVNGRFDLSPAKYNELCDYAMRDDKEIIILCTGISEVLQTNIIQMNNVQVAGVMQRCPIVQTRLTSASDEFRDLCAVLGATFVDSESTKNWSNNATAIMIGAVEKCSGSCEKALLTEFCARFNNPNYDEKQVQTQLDDINQKIKDLEEDPAAHNATILELENRKAFLSRHFAKFYVGGASPQRKSINYELVNDGIPQAISCMKHGIIHGCNTGVPFILNYVIQNIDRGDAEFDDVQTDIIYAILDSYDSMFKQLIANKYGDESAEEIFEKHITQNGYKPLNLRDGDETDVINSADTDRAILQFSTDMAALLATTKAFLSIRGNNEFDIISKGYSLEEK